MSTKILAHRGASFYAPENTLAAFQLAYQQGAHGIETDVHLTKDDIPVMIHDDVIDRVTVYKGPVRSYTYAELKHLDIGSWYHPRYHQERLLTLADFLEWASDKHLILNIELKTNKGHYDGIETIVCQHINRFNMANRVVLSSFNAQSIAKIKEINQQLLTAWLRSTIPYPLEKKLTQVNADGLHLKYKALNNNVVKKLHEKGFYIGSYTVNRADHLRRCFKLGCDMIITDRPDLAIQKWWTYKEAIMEDDSNDC